MLLKPIEALELPKSVLLYILAYAVTKTVPQRDVILRYVSRYVPSAACPMTSQMSTHYLASCLAVSLLLESTKLLVGYVFIFPWES